MKNIGDLPAKQCKQHWYDKHTHLLWYPWQEQQKRCQPYSHEMMPQSAAIIPRSLYYKWQSYQW